ncbi:MAG: hypothetical protein ABSF95_03200 [Verrucomicrobiota bacterium]|jgi:hypothetical protein
MPEQPQQFKVIFCERFNCPPAEYAERAFRKCLYWQARPFAGIIRTLRPAFFFEDFKFIEALGAAVNAREASVDAANFHDVNRYGRGFLRRGWKLRVSGGKAMHLARELFGAGARVRAAEVGGPAPG